MPVIVAETVAGTGVVAIAKVPVDDPAVTVTVEGKVALVELDVRLTTEPPGPAAPLSVTVPVEPVDTIGAPCHIGEFVVPFENNA